MSAGGAVRVARPPRWTPRSGPWGPRKVKRTHRVFSACLLERPPDGQSPWEVCRNEPDLRPGSSALALAGDTERAVTPVTRAPSGLGPGQATPALPGTSPPPRSSLQESLPSL